MRHPDARSTRYPSSAVLPIPGSPRSTSTELRPDRTTPSNWSSTARSPRRPTSQSLTTQPGGETDAGHTASQNSSQLAWLAPSPPPCLQRLLYRYASVQLRPDVWLRDLLGGLGALARALRRRSGVAGTGSR